MEVEVEQVEDVEDYNSDFYSLCSLFKSHHFPSLQSFSFARISLSVFLYTPRESYPESWLFESFRLYQ